MPQTDNDIFPKEEKEAAKRKKIAEMNAVTAQVILKNILANLGVEFEQYHRIKYSVLIIPIGNSGIEISLSDSDVIDQRQIIQDKLTKLFDFISGGASLGEVVTYCRDNRIVYLGYEVHKSSQKNNNSLFELAFVPEGVTSIRDGAFENCTFLKSILLHAEVKSIGLGAFKNCIHLESIELPSGLESIGEGAFVNCMLLKSIELPVGLRLIEKETFEHCESLESIKLPDEVESIGFCAFYGCKSLKSIKLPKELKSIVGTAFWMCTSLKSIELPAGVTSIERSTFKSCSGLTSIIVDINNTVYDSRENCNAIIETATDTLIVGCQNTVIPAGVKSIGEKAFEDCTLLESIELPSGVESIGEWAFSSCESLKSIKLPTGLESIGEGAFYGCNSLKSIELPSGVKSIDGRAIENCKTLKNITFDGTKEECINRWVSKKEDQWSLGIFAQVVHCTDGDVEIL